MAKPPQPPASDDNLIGRLETPSSNAPAAAAQLLPLVYGELRRLAAVKMAGEAPGQTLQATGLVHEAWLRLGADQQPAGRAGKGQVADWVIKLEILELVVGISPRMPRSSS